MRKRGCILCLVSIPVTMFLFASCAAVTVDDTAATDEEPIPIQSIAILPPELPFDYEQKNDTDINQIEIGKEILNALLVEYYKDSDDVKIITQSEQEGMPIDITGSRFALARKAGRLLGCDAVMISTIKRYIPRDASQSRPASVAFDYKLLAVDTGRLLCSGVFDETQQALFDNIFSFRKAFSRKFKWITAKELAREGLYERLDTCFYLKRDRLPEQ